MTEVHKTEVNGEVTYTRGVDGVLHRTDGPAIILASGEEHWYRYGIKHRTQGTGPASTFADGSVMYFPRGFLTRDEEEPGPTIILSDGSEFWTQENLLHRNDGPAVTIKDMTDVPKNVKDYLYATVRAPYLPLGFGKKPSGVPHEPGTYWLRSGCYHSIHGPAIHLTSGEKQFYLYNKKVPSSQYSLDDMDLLLLKYMAQ